MKRHRMILKPALPRRISFKPTGTDRTERSSHLGEIKSRPRRFENRWLLPSRALTFPAAERKLLWPDRRLLKGTGFGHRVSDQFKVRIQHLYLILG
ncbi:unnamed protein product [Citrullus colocynthis]|uniref:Uncharacterized protein n=1 Tax=Citrullus colocynthis TaxID=252529 RepID=A0ABP0ZFY7_9ROSI